MTHPFRPDWTEASELADTRWDGITRDYTPADVEALSGSVRVRHTLAEMGCERLWELLHADEHIQPPGRLDG